jgi:predicted P-loop ATPase
MAKKTNLQVITGEEQPLRTGNIMIDIKVFLNKSYKFRRNVISRHIEVNGNILDDKTLNSIFVQCKTHISKTTKELISSIIFSDYVQDYNPFAEIIDHYIKNYPKNPTGHIDLLISTLETDTPQAGLFIKKWLISLIASINGKHSPLFLVLCGGQNTGKTEWFRRLLPDCLQKYYAESKLDLGKDDEILMTKKLIIMDDEMGGKSKQEHKKIKEMTSKRYLASVNHMVEYQWICNVLQCFAGQQTTKKY